MTLSPRSRMVLLSAGLVLVCLSLFVLAYSLWPGATLSLQGTIAPTLLSPP